MKRKTRNAEKSKQEIIEKAAAVFNQHGYAGTKLEMLIAATGFQKGGIYCHFDSKMDLARAVFKHNLDLLRELYQKDADSSSSPKQQLLGLLHTFKSYIANPPVKGGCPFLNLSVEADDTDETNRLLAKAYLNEWKDQIEDILRHGIASDDFQSDIDPRQEALFMMAASEGGAMLGQVKRSVGLMLGIADSLEKYLHLRIFKKEANP
ncbi:MAG: TetR/AcrR family transcriptional regulator [Bacteroidota bacterium]